MRGAPACISHPRQHVAGHLHTNLIKPAPNSREYLIIYRFDSKENLAKWHDSPEKLK